MALKKSPFSVALLIACALLIHTFDTCSAHLGAFAEPIATAQLSPYCDESPSAYCEICTSNDKHQKNDKHQNDICDSVSEYAVRNSAESHSLHDAGILLPNVAMLPATPIELILSGSLDPRAGPIFVVPFSVTLRHTLPSRAPPLFV